MNIQELVKAYGNQSKVAQAFGVTRMAVTYWVQSGKLPKIREWQIQAGEVKPTEKPLKSVFGKGKGKV